MEHNDAVQPPRTATSTPEQIGPYHIVALLGEGGTGTVYQAVHKITEEVVALKTVLLPHEKYLATIRREIHALSRLEHPGIVRILEHGLWEGSPWYAMEFIVGENLRHYARQHLSPPGDPRDEKEDEEESNTSIDLRNVPEDYLDALSSWDDDDDATEIHKGAWWTESLATPLSLEAWSGVDLDAMDNLEQYNSPSFGSLLQETLEDLTPEEIRLHFIMTVMRRLCEPLAYLHGEGLVHRDLKPENIVIKPDGQPILIDFGLLTRFRGGVGKEHGREQIDGRVVRGGTAAYMAPEQFMGEHIDARADLYALGCIFYELLVGHAPFLGNEQEIAAQHLFGQAIPPSMRLKGLSPQIDALVMRMLVRKPLERIGHATSIAAQLAQWGAAPPDYPEQPTRRYLYPSRMHGRKEELQTLQSLTEGLGEGKSSFASLTSRAGLGKTRLAMEFVRQISNKRWRILSATCQEQGGSALHAFRPLLVSLADRIQEHGAEERVRLLGEHGRILCLYEESLYQVLGGKHSASFASLPPREARPMLLKSLRSALGALATTQPLVYIIDDCQKADELTQGVIEMLLDDGLPPDVMLLCLSRQSEAPWLTERLTDAYHTKTGTQQRALALNPLQAEEISAIIADMLAMKEIPTPFVGSLCELSEGNPFYVSTYMYEAIEEGIFVQDAWGQWQLPDATATIDAVVGEESIKYPDTPLIAHDARALSPMSLQALMEKRLDKLDPLAIVLASAAAILGTHANFNTLQQLVFSDFDEKSLLDGLKTLERVGVLEFASEGFWEFASAPMRELVLERLLPAQRTTLHSKAAEALEQQENTGQHDVTLAYHWHEAGAHEKAKAAYFRAAKQAQSRLANEEAIQLFQQALSLSQEAREEDFPLKLAYAELLSHTGRNAEASSTIQKGQLQAQALASDWWYARFQTEAALLSARRGQLDRAQQEFEHALGIFAKSNAPIEQARIVGNLGNIALERGNIEEAKSHYREALILLRDTEGGERILRLVQSNMAHLLRLQGSHASAKRLFERALEQHRATHDTWFEAVALTSLGCVHWLEGELEQGQECLQHALALHREGGHRRGEGNALGYLSQILHLQGHARTAIEHAHAAVLIMQELPSPRLESLFQVYLQQYLRRAGHSTDDLSTKLDHAQALLEGPEGPGSNNPTLVLIYCERGHLLLANGFSGGVYLAEAKELAQRLRISLNSNAELSQAIARLERAEHAFHHRQPVLFGESPFDHPRTLQHDFHTLPER